MEKILLFREIISREPNPIFNDYYAIERPGRKRFYFRVHKESGITIDLLDEKQLIMEYRKARDAKHIDYQNEVKIREINF